MTTDKIKKYISRMAENLRLGGKGTTFLVKKFENVGFSRLIRRVKVKKVVPFVF